VTAVTAWFGDVTSSIRDDARRSAPHRRCFQVLHNGDVTDIPPRYSNDRSRYTASSIFEATKKKRLL
jgi:hypothetical protein